MKTNWQKLKVISFESDDWGGPDRFGFPDRAAYQQGKNNPDIVKTLESHPVIRMRYDKIDTLESVVDMDALFQLLRRFRGGDGRPAAFTPICFLANPDFEAIRANNFTKYVAIGIDQPYPAIWRSRGDIIAKAREGMQMGVWFPESHNTRTGGHFDPHKWVKILHDKKDRGLSAFFELNMIGRPSAITMDVGLEFDSMGSTELAEWIKAGTQSFRKVYGYAPHLSGTSDARARCKVLGEVMEKLLAQNGVTTIINATHKAMGEYSAETGLTYIQRNANFEPLETNGEKAWESCYQSITQAWENNQPAIVNTHRANYASLDEARKAECLRQLECLLARIQKEHPEAVYMSSHAIAQLYRHDWSQGALS